MDQVSGICPAESLDAEHPLFMLYTSGTTGKPKGVVHTTGGYMTADVHHNKMGVRPQRRRHVLVYGGHRVGDGPQLYRLWSPAERCNNGHVRRCAKLSGTGSLLVNHREISGQHLLHGAHGDSCFHEVGRCLAGQTRSVQFAIARHRRRTDQSGSMDVVPEKHRP